MEMPFTKGPHIRPGKLRLARAFRRQLTPQEAEVWAAVRSNKIGFHFRRQQTVEGFITDFFCFEVKMIVEIDGDIHDLSIEEDARRTRVLETRGLQVVRFTNDEVETDLVGVIRRLRLACLKRAGASL